MAQFFYGGNVAYDEGANVRSLADTLLKAQQTAALSKQANAAAEDSTVKNIASITALMSDPTFQATAAQNPQLAKAIVDKSLEVAGLKNGFIGDLFAKLTGGATNDQMLQTAISNFNKSLSSTALNQIALDTMTNEHYGQPSTTSNNPPIGNNQNNTQDQQNRPANGLNQPVLNGSPIPGGQPLNQQPSQTTTPSTSNVPTGPNASDILGQETLAFANRYAELQNADRISGQRQAAPSPELTALARAALSQGQPPNVDQKVLQDAYKQEMQNGTISAVFNPANSQPTPPLNQAARNAIAAQGTIGAAFNPSTSVVGATTPPGIPGPVTSSTVPSSAPPHQPIPPDRIRTIIDQEVTKSKIDIQQVPLLPDSMLANFGDWYAKTHDGKQIRNVKELATNNRGLIAQYLGSLGLNEKQTQDLITATIKDRMAQGAPQAPTSANQLPESPSTATTPAQSMQGKQLERQVAAASEKLDNTLSSNAANQVMDGIAKNGTPDISNPKTRAVVKSVSYLAVPAIVQNIRDLPPEELQRRWEDSMAVARNMSLEGAVASNQSSLANAKVTRLNSDTQLQVAQLNFLAEMAKLSALAASQQGNPQADQLKTVSELLDKAAQSANTTLQTITTSAKNEGVTLAEYLNRHPELKASYDNTLQTLSAAQNGAQRFIAELAKANGTVLKTEPTSVGLQVILPWLKKTNMVPVESAVGQSNGPNTATDPQVDRAYNAIRQTTGK